MHTNAIPPIDPRDPRIVNPTGEFGPESYLDMGYVSPAKYPMFKSKPRPPRNKRRAPRRESWTLKGMTQTTLDHWLFKPKTPT